MRDDDNWIGKKGVRYWYYRFRDSRYYALSIISLTIIACCMLIFYVIMPQLSNWFSIREEVIATQEKISVLQNNIGFMNTLDRNTLNEQLTIVSEGLPPQKEFGAMLDSISSAAFSSGVSLNDYTFQVGSIASGSAQLTDIRYRGLAVIKIILVVNGSLDNVRRFVSALERNVPLSEVTNIDGNGDNVSLSVQFYQKPYPNVDVSGNKPLEQITADKLAVIQSLGQWRQTVQRTRIIPAATNSAVPLF